MKTKLGERIAICYTGEPRLSGTNNWEIFKRHIDGDPELFELFDGIRDSALRMRAALLADDWDEVSETMRAAYPNRKRLAPGVTTPQMDGWWKRRWPTAPKRQKFAARAAAVASLFFVPKDEKPTSSGR